MNIGLQQTRCNCLSKANIYFDGKRAFCPVCGKETTIEYIDGEPSGIISPNVTIL